MRRNYKMQVEGSYDSMNSFMEYLEGLSDVVVFDDFDLRSSATGTGSRHRASLTLSVIGY